MLFRNHAQFLGGCLLGAILGLATRQEDLIRFIGYFVSVALLLIGLQFAYRVGKHSPTSGHSYGTMTKRDMDRHSWMSGASLFLGWGILLLLRHWPTNDWWDLVLFVIGPLIATALSFVLGFTIGDYRRDAVRRSYPRIKEDDNR